MDKRPIFLILLNIILSITLALSEYFTFGFRFVNGIKSADENEDTMSGIFINDISISEISNFPNEEKVVIKFSKDIDFKIIVNQNANLSFKFNGIVSTLKSEDYKKLLELDIGDSTISINTSKRTLTQALNCIYINGEITEVIETTELWLLALVIISDGKEFIFEIENCFVDLGPDKILINNSEIVL